MSALVSAIIPVFNRSMLARRALRSIQNQVIPSGVELEIIVVDDGSNDETTASLARELRNSKRTSVVAIHHSGMPGAVRNRGVDVSSGDLLAFLDSDDTWEPQKIASQIARHVRYSSDGDGGSGVSPPAVHDNRFNTDTPPPPSVLLSHTRERWIRDGREVSQSSQRHRRTGDLFDDSLVKCIIGPSTVMIARDFFIDSGGFREDLEIAEDYELWLRLTSRIEVGYVDLPLTTKFAGHLDQLSTRYGMIEPFRVAALQRLVETRWFERNVGTEVQDRAAGELVRKCEIVASGARKRGNTADAARYEAIAARWRPAGPRDGGSPEQRL